ncbi:hypothetical protein [Leuconostoc mesenteroides]|uniref:ATP-dependent DNA ligase n=1 Tax=Leuconostoc mesenteroides TaxID=1245 RepID=UPI00235EDE9C|nr:hypothetical protein [Leuconostoc mesenteroides]
MTLSIEQARDVLERVSQATPVVENGLVIATKEQHIDSIIADNPDIARIFVFLLNKFVITNMSSKKLNKHLKLSHTPLISSFDSFLTFLESNPSGRDEDVAIVQQYANETDPIFIKKLASKSLKTGVGIKMYNKIAKRRDLPLVPDFNVQLANNVANLIENYENKPVKPFKLGNVSITEKLDGVRCIAICHNQQVTIRTRDGREITGLTEIITELVTLDVDGVFDGELLADIATNDTNRAEDVFRATMKIVGSKSENKIGLVYHMFDYISSVDDYLVNQNDESYSQRRQALNNQMNAVEALPHLSIVPVLATNTVSSIDDMTPIFEMANNVIANGGEGVMLNNNESSYEFKRTNALLKVKQVSENDGEVVGTFEGQGALTGLLGGIIVRYKNSTVRVGSGFTLEERQEYANNPDQLIGRMATYAFTTESRNEKGELSVRFPRFKAFRIDKTPKDASYDN